MTMQTDTIPAAGGKRIPVLTDIARAASLLRGGAVLCYPTETFFAVGCSAFSLAGIAGVYAAKQRPASMPLPVIIGHRDQLKALVAEPKPATECTPATDKGCLATARALALAFWPAPLSLLLPASAAVPAMLTGGTGKIAVRFTPHPVAAALCRAAGGALVSTSANVSGHPAVTEAARLDPVLCAATQGVLDLPPAPSGGLPSTLVEIVSPGTLRVVRQGAFPLRALETVGYVLVD